MRRHQGVGRSVLANPEITYVGHKTLNMPKFQGGILVRALSYRACTLALKCADSINICLNSYHVSRHSNFSISKRIKILIFQPLFLNFLFLKILIKRKNSTVFQNYLIYCSLNSRFEARVIFIYLF